MDVIRVVLFDTRDFDLLEAPFRKDRISCPKVASEFLMAEAHASRKRMYSVNMLFTSSLQVIDYLDFPVIMIVANSSVPLTRNFVIQFRNRCRNVMGVQIASGRTVLKADNVTILEELNGTINIKRQLVPSRMNDPLIVVVLVMIASHLLLIRTNWISLDMRVEETAAIAHIFQCDLRSKCDI